MTSFDPLDRFVLAQERDATFELALNELRAGAKVGHWIWFVLPQLAGLGSSPSARTYGIGDLDEARAYLAHKLLGPRLILTAEMIATSPVASAVALMGSEIDAMKLRSSMTLFDVAANDVPIFETVLAKYFDAVPDQATLNLLA